MGACCGKDTLGDSIPRNAAVDCSILAQSKSPIICLIGGPGAGKQTVGKRLATKYGLFPVVPTDLMRAEANSATERGETIKKIMIEGRNLPADVIVQAVEQKMSTMPTAAGYLLIGFPREKKQAVLFNKHVRQPNLVVYLWARKQVLEERARSRSTDHPHFDDADHIIISRIKTFFKTVGGVVGVYKTITTHVEAEKSQLEVFELASSAIDAMMEKLEQ